MPLFSKSGWKHHGLSALRRNEDLVWKGERALIESFPYRFLDRSYMLLHIIAACAFRFRVRQLKDYWTIVPRSNCHGTLRKGGSKNSRYDGGMATLMAVVCDSPSSYFSNRLKLSYMQKTSEHSAQVWVT